jgi:hypothetical protein
LISREEANVTEEAKPHNIDVGIRTMVMESARRKLRVIRKQEQQRYGVPMTTMASVGRAILNNWKPDTTKPVGKVQGFPIDAAGNRLTQRGHRKYNKSDLDAVPMKPQNASDAERAEQLLAHLRRVSDPARGTTLGPIAAVRKAANTEGLLDFEVQGKSLRKHIGAAERAVLKPLRFTLPESVYQRIAAKLDAAGCTVTRALEVGLEEFARTGEINNPKG